MSLFYLRARSEVRPDLDSGCARPYQRASDGSMDNITALRLFGRWVVFLCSSTSTVPLGCQSGRIPLRGSPAHYIRGGSLSIETTALRISLSNLGQRPRLQHYESLTVIQCQLHDLRVVVRGTDSLLLPKLNRWVLASEMFGGAACYGMSGKTRHVFTSVAKLRSSYPPQLVFHHAG